MKQMRSRFRLITLLLVCAFLLVLAVCSGTALKAAGITLDSLAAKFYINKYYLSKTFKRQFGQNISAYLQSVRITKAKQLLRFTDKTLDEIGEAVGITPARYFSEVFRTVEGLPPTQYRKQW